MSTEWGAIAPAWVRWSDQLAEGVTPIRERLVERLAPEPGQTILELSAGAGDTGFAIAEAIAPDGTVISSDYEPVMIEAAKRRAVARGLTNIEHRQIDAQAIELPDDSVDGVVCQNGLMLMPDPARAARETRRVLKSGGRLAVAVWTAKKDNPWKTVAQSVLAELGRADPPDAEDGSTALGIDGRLEALLRDAGYTTVETEELDMAWLFERVAEYERWAIELDDIPDVAQLLDEQELGVFRARLDEVFATYSRNDGGYGLPGRELIAIAS